MRRKRIRYFWKECLNWYHREREKAPLREIDEDCCAVGRFSRISVPTSVWVFVFVFFFLIILSSSTHWPPDAKSLLIGKDHDARTDWVQEEKGATEHEMVGKCHWLNGHDFEQTSGDGEGQGSLVCCSPWGCKELDTIQWLNNNTATHVFTQRRETLTWVPV